jgi:hypothetical protein
MTAQAWGSVLTACGVFVTLLLGIFNLVLGISNHRQTKQNAIEAHRIEAETRAEAHRIEAETRAETRRLDERKENRKDLLQRLQSAEEMLKATQRELKNFDQDPLATFPEPDLQELSAMERAFEELSKVSDPEIDKPRGGRIDLDKPPLHKLSPAWYRAWEAYQQLPDQYRTGAPPRSDEEERLIKNWQWARERFEDRVGFCLGYIESNRWKWVRRGA